MGNFAIYIRGVGGHSSDPVHDDTVESIAADTVAMLRLKGHSVYAADVTAGSVVDVDQPSFADAARRRLERAG